MRLFYLLLLSLVATCWGYSFGQSDHLEHLPVLYRLLDEAYLPQDMFANDCADGYNPRKLFFYCLLPLCWLLPVPLVYFLGAWVCNFLTARVSYLIANLLFDKSPDQSGRAGLLAALLVLTVSVVGLGEAAGRRTDFFIPSAVGAVFVFYALYNVLRGHYLQAGILSAVGAFFHPLLCPLGGGLILGWAFLKQFYTYQFNPQAFRRLWAGLFVFASVSLAIILPYYIENFSAQKLSGEEFAKIYAHFRCPHHFLASWFMQGEELKIALCWAALLALLFYQGYKQTLSRSSLGLLLGLSVSLLLLLPFGYYYVEVAPTRLWATIQVFRFLFIIKQLLLILLAGLLCAQPNINRLLLLCTLVDAKRLLLGWVLNMAFGGRKYGFLLLAAVLGWSIYSIYPQFYTNADLYLYFGGLAGSYWFIFADDWRRKAGFWAFVGASVGFLSYYFSHPRQPNAEFLPKACSYQLTEYQIANDRTAISRYLSQNTPDTAVLLCPPNFAELRLTARRSVLIDFKTFPFEDLAMKRWHSQLMDIYGHTDKLGFEAVRWAFEPNYLYSTEADLLRKAKQYGADYIILYQKTAHTLPILYQDSLYKLVAVE